MSYRPPIRIAFLAATALLAAFSGASEQNAKVRVSGRTITVRAEIEIFGDGATRDRADAIRASILRYWAKRPKDGKTWTYFDPVDSKTYDVVFEVAVSLYGGKERRERGAASSVWAATDFKNYMRTPEKTETSYVRTGNHGVLSPNFPGSYAHEFGHLVGLDDHYTVGKDGYSYAKPGYETNIMANTTSGQVEQINIDPIARRILAEYHRSRGAGSAATSADFQTSIDIRNPTD